MAIAISAWVDARSEAAVRAVWRAMGEAGLDGGLHAGPYRPHVTLGIWDELALDRLGGPLAALCRELRPFPLRVEVVGVFPGPKAGVFLVPTVSHELHRLHERVHGLAAPIASGPHRRHLPGAWNAHCTLAHGLRREELPHALAIALASIDVPFELTVDRLGVIDTPAEVELTSVALGG